MFGPPMRSGARTFFGGLAVVVALAGCGGGSPQNAKAPSGRFPVQVSTRFPTTQRLAEHTHLVISVHNSGTKPIPNVSVTICNVTCHYPAPVGEGTSVAAFSNYLNMQGLANHSRPVWVVERPPGQCTGAGGYSCENGGAGGDVSAESNTWQRGSPLKPGGTAVFDWQLAAVQPGHFQVAWEVSGDLYGKAKAVLGDGSIPTGTLAVTISHKPAETYVNDTGQIKTQ
jgi:hypothetical protein